MCKQLETAYLGTHSEENFFAEFMTKEVTETMMNHTVASQEQGYSKNQSSTSMNKRRRSSSSGSSKSGSKRSDKNEPAKKKSKAKHNPASSTLTTKGFQRHYAKHDYHDYAKEKPTQLDMDNIKATRGGVQNPFPMVLHNMLEQANAKGYSDIVSWQPHGRAFLIHKPKDFVAQVLPMYFKHSKLASFQRQLSLYGFIRLTHDGLDRGAYYHECFLQGRYFLCSNIARTRVKGTWVRTSSSPESEPDFYKMEPVSDDLHNDNNSPRVRTVKEGSIKESQMDSIIHHPVQETSPNASTLYNPTKMSSKDVLPTPTYQPPPVIFSDMFSSISSKDINRPAANAGLQPPPFFPTEVIRPDMQNSLQQLSTPPQTTLLNTNKVSEILASALADSAWPVETAPTTPSVQSQQPSYWALNNDDELAQFLLDVDLETDDFNVYGGGIKMTEI